MTADHRVLIDLLLFMAGARTFKCCAIKAAEWIDCIPCRHSRDRNFCYWIKMQLNCLFMSKETRSNGKSWQWHKEIKYERSILIFIRKNLFKYVTVSAHIVWHIPRKEINFLFKCKLLRNDKYLISIPIFFVLSRMI